MGESVENVYDLGAIQAPDNNEKVFLTPGYRKLTVKEFVYEKEGDGKTPCIVAHLEKDDGTSVTKVEEKFYLSGKLNSKGVMSSIVRLQELYKGLTGEERMAIKTSAYTYTKKERDGTSMEYTIPNPSEICAHLNKKCANKKAIFKIGGEVSDDGRVFAGLTYSQFLYYTNKKGELCRYSEERDFSESEYKWAVSKKKGGNAPASGAGITNPSVLDDL